MLFLHLFIWLCDFSPLNISHSIIKYTVIFSNIRTSFRFPPPEWQCEGPFGLAIQNATVTTKFQKTNTTTTSKVNISRNSPKEILQTKKHLVKKSTVRVHDLEPQLTLPHLSDERCYNSGMFSSENWVPSLSFQSREQYLTGRGMLPAFLILSSFKVQGLNLYS